MDESTSFLGDVTVFPALDDSNGYRQIKVYKAGHDKTFFTSHNILYIYTIMPFALRTAFGSIQRTMGVIISPIKWQCALVYLDGIVLFQKRIGNTSNTLSLY